MSKKTVLKQGMMSKRAQGKSAMGRINWRARFFVLTPTELQYWDKFGGQESQASLKGTINLRDVTAVELVDDNTFDKKHMFQIMHSNYILYTQGSDENDRREWMDLLRQNIANNTNLQQSYHSGMCDGKWTCCKSQRDGFGCKSCFDYSSLKDSKRTSSDPGSAPNIERDKPRSMTSLQPQAPMSPLPQTPTTPNGDQIQARPLPPKPQQPSLPPVPEPPKPEHFEVVAMYSYEANQPQDLSINKGDRLTVLETEEEHWWKARDTQGRTGFIPSNYVRKCGLESEPWFHGRMGRSEAAVMLRNANQEGCFLVRESESVPGEYSLSVSHGDSLRHYRVKHAEDTYFINERHKFRTISELVEYHMHNSGGLVTRLRKSLKDLNAPVTAGLGHDKWEIDPNEISMGKELGSGQFGVVKQGLYKNGIKVAVKMMKSGAMSEDDFIAEAQVMKNFRHQNLVQLYGVCTKVRPIYIVTEFMSKGCLLDYLRNNQGLASQPDTLHYMSVQIASAMTFLESHLFIHRDLAARNCLIGENYVVKVADFGLARYVLDDEYTASEGTKFPIKWAAPEVISYARFSTKSDVWSYGILLWEIWSIGRTPYPSFTNMEVVDKVVEGYRLPSPQAATHEMHQLMLDCWHHDPEFRPAFAEVEQRLRDKKTEYEDAEDL
eukprot:m.49809 g.49809  ORF g.49809 m.49809 type:complete len:663 (+) comp17953_c0_seq1:32-2020(+)